MSVVVAYKFAPNPQDAQVGADGVVDWGRAKPSVSEYDPAAIGLARLVADAAGEDVVGVTVGTSAAAASMAKRTHCPKDWTVRLFAPTTTSSNGMPPR